MGREEILEYSDALGWILERAPGRRRPRTGGLHHDRCPGARRRGPGGEGGMDLGGPKWEVVFPAMIRLQSLRITPKAALSRGMAGIRNRTLIINLPGSPNAVAETIGFLAPLLPHALETVTGNATECAKG